MLSRLANNINCVQTARRHYPSSFLRATNWKLPSDGDQNQEISVSLTRRLRRCVNFMRHPKVQPMPCTVRINLLPSLRVNDEHGLPPHCWTRRQSQLYSFFFNKLRGSTRPLLSSKSSSNANSLVLRPAVRRQASRRDCPIERHLAVAQFATGSDAAGAAYQRLPDGGGDLNERERFT